MGSLPRAISDPSQPAYIPGFRVVVHIPFRGDKAIFALQASTYSLSPPRADIGDGELRLVVEYPHDSPANIRGEAQALIQSVANNLRHAQADIEGFNSGLQARALQAIRSRRERVERHHAHVEKTGLPVGPPADREKTQIADRLVRRPAPRVPAKAADEPVRLEPVLADEVFDHMLEVLRLAAVGIERSPTTYAGMGEEDLRQVLLNALNTHYRGEGTAEAFNVTGKTDILVRHEGSNLFVGECKFWTGSQGFREAVGQLFGYTAWRDTKLALILFVRERKLTAILDKARQELEAHEQFVRWQPRGARPSYEPWFTGPVTNSDLLT